MRPESIQNKYHINQRIEAEEIVLGTAAMVVASTQQEVNHQYAEYDNYHAKRMVVIPPGVNLERFHPPNGSENDSLIAKELARFLDKPTKPMILALSRADERKNITALVQAYGESHELQEAANLVIVAGNRDDIKSMEKGQREVLSQLIFQIDKYDLYGKVAYPKHHEPEDVPVLYRLAAKRRGVFVNPALTEPFGLTLIEAAASGLPIVATHDGGPREIVSFCDNGLLIDPLNVEDIKTRLHDALSNTRRWTRWSKNGIAGANRHYSWPGHAKTYLEKVREILTTQKQSHWHYPKKSRLPTVDRLAFSAIDNALFGDEDSMRELLALVAHQGKHIGYGIATGRSLTKTKKFLKQMNLKMPDILITSVGTEIYYCHSGDRIIEDTSWRRHIDYRWQPEALRKLMDKIPGLFLVGENII